MSGIFDANIHALEKADHERVGLVRGPDLVDACAAHAAAFPRLGVTQAQVFILNPGFFRRREDADSLSLVAERFPRRFRFGALFDFRRGDAADLLDEAAKRGLRSVKFHAYRQKIREADYPRALRLCKAAEKRGLTVTVCCSYGTADLDAYSGVRLAAHVAPRLKCPVVMAHGGGAKVIDAMLVADAAPNVFLNTSFSLDYYKGSRIEDDFAFAVRKLGAGRWMFGSDAPFMPQADSLKNMSAFLKRHRFSDGEARRLMGGTAEGLL